MLDRFAITLTFLWWERTSRRWWWRKRWVASRWRAFSSRASLFFIPFFTFITLISSFIQITAFAFDSPIFTSSTSVTATWMTTPWATTSSSSSWAYPPSLSISAISWVPWRGGRRVRWWIGRWPASWTSLWSWRSSRLATWAIYISVISSLVVWGAVLAVGMVSIPTIHVFFFKSLL